MSKINSVTFPHQDENYWLMIDVGGQKKPQYPSPLEVQMMIQKARQEEREYTLKTIDLYNQKPSKGLEWLKWFLTRKATSDGVATPTKTDKQ